MIDKNSIRDTALVAVMQHYGHSHERNRDGSFRICIPDEQFAVLVQRYRLEYRPVLQRIKRLRKDLQPPERHAQASPMTEICLDHAPKAHL